MAHLRLAYDVQISYKIKLFLQHLHILHQNGLKIYLQNIFHCLSNKLNICKVYTNNNAVPKNIKWTVQNKCRKIIRCMHGFYHVATWPAEQLKWVKVMKKTSNVVTVPVCVLVRLIHFYKSYAPGT
jgi:hypothetical protein